MTISKLKLKYSSLFFIPFILMLGVFLCLGLTPFSKSSIHSGDFLSQYFPLYIGLHKMFWNGDFSGLFWSFEKSLGGAMPSVWGFNSLSPFTFLYVLFPISSFHVISYIIPLIRFGVMGLVFGYFIEKKYQAVSKRYWLAVGLCTSYALSGFIISQHYNPNFLDNLVYVPFIFLGIEDIFHGKKSIKLPVFLALSLITNFYTGYMMCLLIILYTMYIAFSEEQSWKEAFAKIMRVALFSLIGVGMAAFWLLPVFSALLESKASASSTFEWSFKAVNDLVSMSQKFIVGSFGEKEWGDPHALPQLFIGSLGLFGLFTFYACQEITLRKKIMASIVLVAMILSFHIQGLDQIWHMGQRPVGFYFRNSWIANSFLFVLASESLMKWKAEFNWTHVIVTSVGFGSILVASLMTSLKIVDASQKILAFVIWTIVLMIVFIPKINIRRRYQLLSGIVLFELALNAFIGLRRVPYFVSRDSIQEQMTLASKFDEKYGQTRHDFQRMEIHKGLSYANFPIAFGYNGGSHFTSSLEYSLIQKLGQLGLATSQSVANYSNRNVILDSLLGVSRMMMTGDEKSAFPDMRGLYLKEDTFEKYTVYKNPYVFSLGFLTNESKARNVRFNQNAPVSNLNQLLEVIGLNSTSALKEITIPKPIVKNLEQSGEKFTAINEEEETQIQWTIPMNPNKLYFVQIPVSQSGNINKSKAMLDGTNYSYEVRFHSNQLWPIGNGNLASSLNFSFEKGKVKEWNVQDVKFYELDIPTLANALEQTKKENSITIDSYSNSTVKAHVTVTDSNQGFATFTIPYHSGWSVLVDGKKQEVKKSLDLFMGVTLKRGEHEIVWAYDPPGLKIGSLISILSVCVLIFLLKYSQMDTSK